MKRYVIGGLITVALIASYFVVTSAVEQTFQPVAQPAPVAFVVQPPLSPESLLERANKERAAVGVEPLTLDEGVQKSAQLKADDMIDRNYRSHFLPENPKATLTEKMASYIEPVCVSSSENYVYNEQGNEQTVNDAFEWWLNSPDHKAAILDPQYTKTGFGISGSIVVQHFCVAR